MYLALVITAHVPYVRQAHSSPKGEDALHETISSSLIPLLIALSELRTRHRNPYMGLALSPLLIEQLADPVVQKHFVLWMQHWINRYRDDLTHWEREGKHHEAYLARFYIEWGEGMLSNFENRYKRNILAIVRDHCAHGIIEPLASAASYAYLPLLGRNESVRAQIEQGVLSITQHLGRPHGLWLPGCGWREGIAHTIAEAGLSYTIVDPRSLPTGPLPAVMSLIPRRLSALVCNDELSRYIWSPDVGYMRDPPYRDEHSLGGYHAIGLGAAQPYDPYHAFRRAQEHAAHFVALLADLARQRDPLDLLLLPLDVGLLGLRWFEGVTWLQGVLTLVATHPSIVLTTPGSYLRRQRQLAVTPIETGSWSDSGMHHDWQQPPSRTYWHALHRMEERLASLVRLNPHARGVRERLLNQAARELLLAQDSTWALALGSDNKALHDAGDSRWRSYLQNCDALTDLALRDRISAESQRLLEQLEEQHGPFPHLNYRTFGS